MKISTKIKEIFFPEKKIHYRTLYSEEEKQQKRIEREERKAKLKGNRGLKLKVEGLSTEDLLLKAGYNIRLNGSYIRFFDGTPMNTIPCYRYHAYVISLDTISIHTDYIVKRADGITYHVASEYMVPKEIARLKVFLPMKRRKKDIVLDSKTMKKALEELKNKKTLN